jgi:HTH-type transcriptional regulator / antitoxin HigA
MAFQHEIASTADLSDYMQLVREFPLRPFRNDGDMEAAGAMLDRLLDRKTLSEGQQDYLDVLGSLIKDYEDAQHPMPQASGVEVLQFLMEQHGLRQSDLAPMLGSKSVVSEVLRGKRKLNLRHVRRLSDFFGVSADAFIGAERDHA